MCCERCPGATQASTRHIAKRRLLKAAVFQPQVAQATENTTRADTMPADMTRARTTPAATPPANATRVDLTPASLYQAVTGQIVDAGPQVMVICQERRERRFVLTARASAWRGSPLDPASLRIGDRAVLRVLPSRSDVADRIWANIGRVTGTIMVRDQDRLVVAEGSTKKLQTVVIPPRARVRIQVRFPTLQPGYLVDIIGVRHRDHLEGLHPATPQPHYRSDLVPKDLRRRLPETINGSATWHESADEPYGVLGVSYPAIDPSAGCLEDSEAGYAHGEAPAYRDLPYLAVGTALNIRNECTGISWTLPVTGCAPIARLFNDRCVACQNSDRGRVADLTLASFVALGGELDAGCFNATLTIGR